MVMVSLVNNVDCSRKNFGVRNLFKNSNENSGKNSITFTGGERIAPDVFQKVAEEVTRLAVINGSDIVCTGEKGGVIVERIDIIPTRIKQRLTDAMGKIIEEVDINLNRDYRGNTTPSYMAIFNGESEKPKLLNYDEKNREIIIPKLEEIRNRLAQYPEDANYLVRRIDEINLDID